MKRSTDVDESYTALHVLKPGACKMKACRPPPARAKAAQRLENRMRLPPETNLNLETKPADAPVPTASVEFIFISAGHSLFGNRGDSPKEHPPVSVDEAECVAGRGLQGDRFFDYRPDYCGQVTFFSMETFEELCRATKSSGKSPGSLRRNVFVRGVDLNTLIGKNFSLQGIGFSGSQECSPCHWMNLTFGAGAEAFLKGRGGLRARILSSGILRVRNV